MVRFSDDAEKATDLQAGEYLFKIYEVNEKVSQMVMIIGRLSLKVKKVLKFVITLCSVVKLPVKLCLC